MSVPASQCAFCKHLVADRGNWHCAAFLQGIPREVKNTEHDHRQPIEGDHGIRWEPYEPGVVHPLDLLTGAA